VEVLWVIIAIVAIAIAFRIFSTVMRRKQLLTKYGDEEIVRRIMKKLIWEGQSKDQLIDSLGRPLDVDQKVLKTKSRETWKYQRTGKNRYRLRVVVENDIVIGWEKRG